MCQYATFSAFNAKHKCSLPTKVQPASSFGAMALNQKLALLLIANIIWTIVFYVLMLRRQNYYSHYQTTWISQWIAGWIYLNIYRITTLLRCRCLLDVASYHTSFSIQGKIISLQTTITTAILGTGTPVPDTYMAVPSTGVEIS